MVHIVWTKTCSQSSQKTNHQKHDVSGLFLQSVLQHGKQCCQEENEQKNIEHENLNEEVYLILYESLNLNLEWEVRACEVCVLDFLQLYYREEYPL